MKKLLLFVGLLAFICTPALAGKNEGGALVCHTDNATIYTSIGADYCTTHYVPPTDNLCGNANTESTVDGNFDAAVIWLLAAFPDGSNPGVTVVFFGIEHNLPFGYFASWTFCGPAGSLEIPDAGWPNDWATAGNSVAFGTPIVGQQLFMYYWLAAWGTPGNYLGTGINPTGGYAGFVSDDNPGILDEIFLFGRVDWFAAGENECPTQPPTSACCYPDGSCAVLTETECYNTGGIDWSLSDTCDPNPCPQPGACCDEAGDCTFVLEIFCDDLFLGELIECEPINPCPPPSGACCDDQGNCIYVPADQCMDDYLGDLIPCDPNPCPQPGACCDALGNCTYVLQELCADDYLGDLIPCDPNPCPQPGACCYGDMQCAYVLEEECETIPDNYDFIPETPCEPDNPCPPPIPVEETTWGSIKADYR